MNCNTVQIAGTSGLGLSRIGNPDFLNRAISSRRGF
jgi:hypothetical protein